MPRSVKRERVCFDVVEGGGIEPAALDPQTSAACPRTSSRRPIFLKNKDFAPRRISVDKAKWWSKWWSDP